MTIWKDKSEKQDGNLNLIFYNNHDPLITRYESNITDDTLKWCFLDDLLNLEKENERLKKQLEVAINEIKYLQYYKMNYGINNANLADVMMLEEEIKNFWLKFEQINDIEKEEK